MLELLNEAYRIEYIRGGYLPKWVEDILIKSKDFSLPKKRELINNIDIEVVLVDVTECEIG